MERIKWQAEDNNINDDKVMKAMWNTKYMKWRITTNKI